MNGKSNPCWRQELALDKALRLLAQVQHEWLKTIRERDELLKQLTNER